MPSIACAVDKSLAAETGKYYSDCREKDPQPLAKDEDLAKKLTASYRRCLETGVPISYFGTDSTTLLPSMSETGAEVLGLDWRVPLDEGWRSMGHHHAVQGNLDPVTLFGSWNEVKQRAEDILRLADGRPGHIFNLGHGILPHTPVDNVKNLAQFVREFSTAAAATR